MRRGENEIITNKKISRQSKRLALLTFVQDMSMPIPLSCEGTPLSLDRLGMSFFFL